MTGTGPQHERWADASGSYLLGSLPAGEHAAFEEHLLLCAACRDEVRELRPAAEALPACSPPVSPPAGLKLRIMSEIGRDGSTAAPVTRAPEPARWRSRWRWSPARAAAVGALCAGLLAGVAADRLLTREGRTVPLEVDAARAPGASGQLRVHSGGATLVVTRLPAPPRGRVYQVWIKRPGRPPDATATLFEPRRDGSAVAAVPGSVEAAEAVLVTQEPDGGSQAPSAQPLIAARL